MQAYELGHLSLFLVVTSNQDNKFPDPCPQKQYENLLFAEIQ